MTAIKRIISCVIAACMLLPASVLRTGVISVNNVSADTESKTDDEISDDIPCEFDYTTNTLTIHKCGNIDNLPDIESPFTMYNNAENIIIDKGVTNLPALAAIVKKKVSHCDKKILSHFR